MKEMKGGRCSDREMSLKGWVSSVIVLVLVLVHSVLVVADTDPGDQAVLASFLQGLDQASGNTLGWSGNDACGGDWAHIQCSGVYISAIQVGNLGLSGTVTNDINKLSRLTRLELQGNKLTGTLPTLSGLASLTVALLQNNQFTVIPGDFFSGTTGLVSVYLDYNNLNETGWTIPADLTSCIALANLSMTSVNLVGTLPDFLGTMLNLKVLALAYNSLTGSIPATFENSNLVQLQLNNQKGPVFNGNIDAVGGMLSLKQLWLHVNSFTGSIPEGLGNAVSLADLNLNTNNFVGQIPPSFANLPLLSFNVRNNKLDGPLPNFASSVKFNYSNNGFCKDTVGEACSAETTALLTFLAGVNYSPSSLAESWVGDDPCSSWTGVTCDATNTHVTVVNLRNSGLSGTIASSVADLTSLSSLILSGNNLTGDIPTQLTDLKSIKTVDVSNNNLSGTLPVFSSGVSFVYSGNPLLSTTTPSAPGSSPAASPPASPSTPAASPPATPSTSTPPAISTPPSTNTPPATSTPPAISTPPATSTPPAISTPPGVVPPSSGTSNPPLGSPSGSGSENGTVLLSGKKSSGVPVGAIVGAILGGLAVLVAAVILFFCMRRKKRQRLLSLQGPNTVMVHPRDSASDPEVVKIVVASNPNTTTATDTYSRASSGPSEIQVVEAGNLVISIQVLRAVTKNFSDDNVLGRGGFGVVYKGELEDGTKIAVKRMEAAVVSSKGLSEFQAEIAVLTKVRHRHLVALLGYCAEGNERLLVYEYMPQGTLSQHIFEHAKLGFKPLDWNRRLSIALDVARGMEYLHSLAHKSFIHRDLKPSNILLGDDFRAKVSDFGLVKLAPEGKFSVETRLAGTFGYLAPEYAVTGRVTTKADVFSFGVVLMELITGRKALDETQTEENMHLVTWFRRMNNTKESFIKAIDSVIDVTEDSFRGILVVAELAGHCTAREPYQRPDMGHAVNVLAPLVEQWKPTDLDEGEGGIDLEMTLPQALKQWQMYEDASLSGLDDTKASLPTRPSGFAESFTSADGR